MIFQTQLDGTCKEPSDDNSLVACPLNKFKYERVSAGKGILSPEGGIDWKSSSFTHVPIMGSGLGRESFWANTDRYKDNLNYFGRARARVLTTTMPAPTELR